MTISRLKIDFINIVFLDFLSYKMFNIIDIKTRKCMLTSLKYLTNEIEKKNRLFYIKHTHRL